MKMNCAAIWGVLAAFVVFFSSVKAQERLSAKLNNYLHEINVNKNFSGTVLVAKRNKILLGQDLRKDVAAFAEFPSAVDALQRLKRN